MSDLQRYPLNICLQAKQIKLSLFSIFILIIFNDGFYVNCGLRINVIRDKELNCWNSALTGWINDFIFTIVAQIKLGLRDIIVNRTGLHSTDYVSNDSSPFQRTEKWPRFCVNQKCILSTYVLNKIKTWVKLRKKGGFKSFRKIILLPFRVLSQTRKLEFFRLSRSIVKWRKQAGAA